VTCCLVGPSTARVRYSRKITLTVSTRRVLHNRLLRPWGHGCFVCSKFPVCFIQGIITKDNRLLSSSTGLGQLLLTSPSCAPPHLCSAACLCATRIYCRGFYRQTDAGTVYCRCLAECASLNRASANGQPTRNLSWPVALKRLPEPARQLVMPTCELSCALFFPVCSACLVKACTTAPHSERGCVVHHICNAMRTMAAAHLPPQLS